MIIIKAFCVRTDTYLMCSHTDLCFGDVYKRQGILKYNLPTAAQLVVKGIVIVIMIIFDAVYNDIMQKRIQRKAREDDTESAKMAGGEA